MKKTKLRENPPRWCEVEIELKDGKLSICGSEGRIVTKDEGRKEAIQSWINYFEEDENQIWDMHKRCSKQHGKFDLTPEGAAAFVVKVDGEFHGLDVHKQNGTKLYLVEGCGQITESLAEWFPEVAPYLKYHLNDMKAGCEHQEALGWGKGKDIALTADTLTEAQAKTLTAKAEAQAMRERAEYVKKWITELGKSKYTRQEFAKKHGIFFSISADSTLGELANIEKFVFSRDHKLAREALALIEAEAIKECPQVPFKAKIYEDSLSAPCPECGYEYGTKWLKRELSPEVNQFFAAFEGDRGDEG